LDMLWTDNQQVDMESSPDRQSGLTALPTLT
jgi:hypothetical protein